jgi:hypothetical protein
VGSDLSPRAVRRAALEAERRGLSLPTTATDMRSLPFAAECFDVVLSGGNSVANC